MSDATDRPDWRILLVEDEPDNLEVIAETLEYLGFTVKTAQNGLEGMEVLKSYAPTLILLDLSMPKMDGWQMHRLLRDDPRMRGVPIVALTAHAMAGDKQRALEAGFDGYLTKPISIGTFLKELKEAAAGQQHIPG